LSYIEPKKKSSTSLLWGTNGSLKPLSIAELAGLVGRICEKEVEIMQPPKPNLVPERYLPLVSKAAKELDFNLFHLLEDSISKTVLWHRQFT